MRYLIEQAIISIAMVTVISSLLVTNKVYSVLPVDASENGTILLKPELKEQIYLAKDCMLNSGKWKLIRQPMVDGDMFYLFDRFNDPQNKKDVSRVYPDVFEDMNKKLLAYNSRIGKQ